MIDENNDFAEAETDTVELSDNDDPENFDYHDPDEEQDDGAVEETEGTDDEPDEAEAEDEAEDQETEDEPEAPALADDVIVKMGDGTTLTLAELKDSPMLKADHTRKTQELSNERKAVEADVQRMEAITQNFVSHLSQLVPPAPEPSLALSDPNAYTAQRATHEAAMEQLQTLMGVQAEIKDVSGGMTEADRKKEVIEENGKLVAMFPEAESGETREKFFGDVAETAVALGFSHEELGQVTDHRIFALAHYAKVGQEFLKNKTKAKAKVAKAPPAPARKPGGKKAKGNAAAMRKLRNSGSLDDALKVDFDF